MPVLTEARAARVVGRSSSLDFDTLSDPRRQAGVVFPLDGLLRLQLAAMASGKQSLRATENFADDLTVKGLRALGLKQAPSDTTLYDLGGDPLRRLGLCNDLSSLSLFSG